MICICLDGVAIPLMAKIMEKAEESVRSWPSVTPACYLGNGYLVKTGL